MVIAGGLVLQNAKAMNVLGAVVVHGIAQVLEVRALGFGFPDFRYVHAHGSGLLECYTVSELRSCAYVRPYSRACVRRTVLLVMRPYGLEVEEVFGFLNLGLLDFRILVV